MTIAELIIWHGLDTDKSSPVGHHYGPFYDRELAPYCDRPIRLLEIGVNAGGSLRLWREFLGVSAEIVGVDLGPPKDDLSGIATVVIGDAYTRAVADRLGAFDIVIDDGSHHLGDMLAVIRLYLPRLRPGGLMVIEDVQRFDWFDRLAAAVPDGTYYEAIDLRASGGVSDDMLFVARKPA